MPPKRKHDPGYKLPEVIEPDENCCICIPIPNDFNHKMAFLGQLDELGYWWTWERDPDKKGREAAAVWRKIVECIREEMDMSGCGCDGDRGQPTNQRYTEDGFLEVSYDGGETWENGNAIDPRFNSPVWTPLSGADGDTKKCAAANSIVTALKEEKAASSAVLGAAGGLAGLVIAVAGFVAGTGVGIVAGVIIALIGGVLTLIVNGGQAAFDASFDEEFWADVLCILYCNMSDDASFTPGQWSDAINDIKGLSPYPANDWTQAMVKSVGAVGLTNLARSNRAGALSCEGCECVPACEDPERFTVGTVVGSGVDGFGNQYFDVESGINPIDGSDVVIWGQLGILSSVCCTWESTAFIEGDCAGSTGRFITPTGTTDQIPFESASPAENISAFAVLQNGCPFGNPFTVRLTFTACTE